jgi:sugar phosphate isomerase/epimerase
MKIALHPAVCGGDLGLLADYCRYLGVADLFYHLHDVEGYRDGALADPRAVQRLQDRFGAAGLRLSALNLFLPDDAETLAARRDRLPDTLDAIAAAGVETVIVFALQEDGADTWTALADLYRDLVPRAQSLGIRLATHGHWHPGHLVFNRATAERLIAVAPAPCHGICLCLGCYHQAGDDVVALVGELADRIHCVHVRDTALVGESRIDEGPLGCGTVPLREALLALRDVGYDGLVIPEHLGAVAAQAGTRFDR